MLSDSFVGTALVVSVQPDAGPAGSLVAQMWSPPLATQIDACGHEITVGSTSGEPLVELPGRSTVVHVGVVDEAFELRSSPALVVAARHRLADTQATPSNLGRGRTQWASRTTAVGRRRGGHVARLEHVRLVGARIAAPIPERAQLIEAADAGRPAPGVPRPRFSRRPVRRARGGGGERRRAQDNGQHRHADYKAKPATPPHRPRGPFKPAPFLLLLIGAAILPRGCSASQVLPNRTGAARPPRRPQRT